MNHQLPWRQATITFPTWARAEPTALAHLLPLLRAADDAHALTAWFFIRKHPCWRVRYSSDEQQHARLHTALDTLAHAGHIAGWTPAVYEPEVHAFGGTDAMATAHRLFHHDSRELATFLRADTGTPRGHRREMSLLLCSALMRSAGLDWYEQGDVWARVAAHREPPAATGDLDRLRTAVHRLLSVDAERHTRDESPLSPATAWLAAYTTAGRELRELAASGSVHRGLREILAHHILFAWNRCGLPHDTQAVLASTATAVIFGPDPSTAHLAAARFGAPPDDQPHQPEGTTSSRRSTTP